MLDIREYRRQLIMAHPTFMCPLNQSLLDVDQSMIIKFWNKKKNRESIDVVSIDGFKSLPQNIIEENKIKEVLDFDEI